MPFDVAPAEVVLKDHELVAVDPGKFHCALAYFRAGTLTDVCLIREETTLEVGLAAGVWIQEATEDLDVLIFEGQECYPGMSSAINNSLLPLAFCNGVINAIVHTQVRQNPLPKSWKGSTPGDLFVRRTIENLNDQELAIYKSVHGPKDMMHNVADAIALGKWSLKHARN